MRYTYAGEDNSCFRVAPGFPQELVRHRVLDGLASGTISSSTLVLDLLVVLISKVSYQCALLQAMLV